MCDIPYEFTKARLVRSPMHWLCAVFYAYIHYLQKLGAAVPSLVSLQMENYADKEAIIKDAASSMYAGG